MANTSRRPRRSHATELRQDLELLAGSARVVGVLRDRYADVAEFTVCGRMLADAEGELRRRLSALGAN